MPGAHGGRPAPGFAHRLHTDQLFLVTETDGAKYVFLVLFLLFKECALLAVVTFGLQAVSIPENKDRCLTEPWCVVRSPGRVCMAPDWGQGLSWRSSPEGAPQPCCGVCCGVRACPGAAHLRETQRPWCSRPFTPGPTLSEGHYSRASENTPSLSQPEPQLLPPPSTSASALLVLVAQILPFDCGFPQTPRAMASLGSGELVCTG